MPVDRIRFHEVRVCPVCRRATTPYLLRVEDAQETARPRIPKRFVLECSRSHANKLCGNVWYENAED